MTCNAFQSLIMPFIHGKLSIQKKEELLMHLLACPKCAEELEIYYIIVNCIKGLDEEIDFPDDYRREYLGFLKKTEKEIKQYKKKHFRQRTAFSAVLALSVILTGVSFRSDADEDENRGMKFRELTESDLDMRFRFRDNHIFYEESIDREVIQTLLKQGR